MNKKLTYEEKRKIWFYAFLALSIISLCLLAVDKFYSTILGFGSALCLSQICFISSILEQNEKEKRKNGFLLLEEFRTDSRKYCWKYQQNHTLEFVQELEDKIEKFENDDLRVDYLMSIKG